MDPKLNRSWIAALVIAFMLASVRPADAKKPCNCGAKKHAPAGTAEFFVQSAREKSAAHQFAAAEELARKAVAQAGKNDEARAKAYGVLGFALGHQEKYAAAVDAYRQAVTLRTQAKHLSADEVDDVATQLQAMAALQRQTGDVRGAEASMQHAVDLMAKQHGRNAEVTKLFVQAAKAMR